MFRVSGYIVEKHVSTEKKKVALTAAVKAVIFYSYDRKTRINGEEEGSFNRSG